MYVKQTRNVRNERYTYDLCYKVIALKLVNIVPSWDIERRELANVRRYPIEGQYSPVSVYKTFYYIAMNIYFVSRCF